MPLMFPFPQKVMAQAGAAEAWQEDMGALLPLHKLKMGWKWWENSSLTKDSPSSPSRPLVACKDLEAVQPLARWFSSNSGKSVQLFLS